MGMLQLGSRGRGGLSVLGLFVAPGALVLGCSDDIVNHYSTNNYYTDGGAQPEAPAAAGKAAGGEGGKKSVVPEGGEGGVPAEVGGAGAGGDGVGGASGGAGGDDSGIDPRYPDAPLVDTEIADLPLDIFGTIGNRYWFGVSDEQLVAMNNRDQGCAFCGWGGLYTPGGSRANFVDHLYVTTAGDEPKTADYGKVQAKVVGQSTYHPWDRNNIPNINIDADQFIEGQRIAGYEHLRFGNGQFGSIFRDKFAYDLYRQLHYPAPLAAYVWVQSNVWGPDISIPYTLIERYKRTFCDRYATEFGGGCPNMWEFYGDFNYYGGGGGGGKGGPIIDAAALSIFDNAENCQMGSCDSTRVKELEAKLYDLPMADGFKDALADYVDWPAFHRFQCISWVFSTSDDPIHANNNVVLVERADGMFQYLPYSVDFSFGSSGTVDLRGQNVLSQGCQADTACWADTLDTCEDVIAEFEELDPQKYLSTLYKDLDANGMLRPGDEANFQGIKSYLTERLAYLPEALERYRSGSNCEYPYEDCNGQCVYQGQCSCVPPKEPLPGGEAGAPAQAAPPPIDPGMGGMVGVGGAAAAGGGVGVGGGIIGGGGPICPMDVNYAIAPK